MDEATGPAWTPAIPFTPSHVSVNRVRIVDLPGVPMDPEVRGQLAYHLVSVPAVVRYAREQAGTLALPQAYLSDSTETQRDLPRFVDASLGSPDEARRSAAEAIAERLGRNLGHILLALHRGDAVNRAARGEWSDADWARWGAIRRVWLSGGLLSGELGRRIAFAAQAWLAEAGRGEGPAVKRDAFGPEGVLRGASRHLPPADGWGLCLDFGQTSVKRGIFVIEDGIVQLWRSLQPADAGARLAAADHHDALARGRHVCEFIAAVVGEGWQMAHDAGARPLADVIIAVAAYVNNGRLLGNGPYAAIHALGDDARPILSEAATRLTGSRVHLHPIHDGTAAAALHAGEADAAVLVAGTALGIGFPPATEAGLLRLTPNQI